MGRTIKQMVSDALRDKNDEASMTILGPDGQVISVLLLWYPGDPAPLQVRLKCKDFEEHYKIVRDDPRADVEGGGAA